MYGFWFKKTIFYGWDHILGLFLANIGYLVLLGSCILWIWLRTNDHIGLAAELLLTVASIVAASFYTMVIAHYAANINDGAPKGQALKGAADTVRSHIPHILLHAFITTVIVVNIVYAIPFYMESEGFTGPMMAFVGLFLSIFLIANFKYYLPLCLMRPEEGVVDIVKYSFAYALDNKGVTFMLLLRSAADLLISVPFAGIIPGFAGILVSDTCAADLLNRRYLLAEEKNTEKSAVTWDETLDSLGDERGRVEKRRFLSLLFPGR
ncbi:MAG: hypothetical protein J6P87_07315 [Lachnospiraceae bacterium]|nr:hypothetical protein [Lachnospiraceae bacterium]